MAGVGTLEDVESDGIVNIGRVKVDNIINPIVGNTFQKLMDQLSVRINDPNSLAVLHVLDGHIAKDS